MMYARLRHWFTRIVSVGCASSVLALGGSIIAAEASPLAQTAPGLGTASSFSVLGGTTVTNTGATTVQADLGVSPGTAVTGFPPGSVTGGSIHAADALAGQAQSDVTTAYNTLAGQPCPGGNNLTGQDLGGKSLVPGVYCYDSSAQLTGALTLNSSATPNGVFIFQIGSTLTTASNASVNLVGSSACNVFWKVGSSATLGTGTRFVGSILALTSISLQTTATVVGRALARNGAVTMDDNTVGGGGCAVGVATATPTATATASPSRTPTAVAATATPTASPTSAPSSGSGGSTTSSRPAPTAVLTPNAGSNTTTAPAGVSGAAPNAAQTGNAASTPTPVIPALQAPTPAALAISPTSAAEAAGSMATDTAMLVTTPVAEVGVETGEALPVPTAVEAETYVAPTAVSPAALPGRAGGLDPLAIAGVVGALGMLSMGAGLLRRRRGVR